MGMTKNVLICGLVVGLFIVGCGQDQEPPKYAGEGDTEIEKGSKMMQQSEAETRASARASAEAELEARVAAEIAAEARAEARIEARVEAETETNVRVEPEAEVELEAEVEARAKAVVRAETRARAEGGIRSREGKRAFIIIDSAYRLLDQGKYTEAISSAQNVLDNYDSDSQEARSIITKAKEKLQATAEAKAGELLEASATEKDDLTNKLKSLGQ
jgi:hypothetical protein